MAPEIQGTINPEVEILSRLEEHGLLEITELEVRIRRGIAFIKGTVPNLRQKKLAGEIASEVDGIHGVVNMLRITPLLVIDDESLRKHIRRALSRNPRIDISRISVEVVDGVVHLGGFVSIAAQKRLADQEIWSAAGVRDIINKIEVLSATPKSEIQVMGEILQGFSECLGLDLSKLSVEMRDGVLHLGGVVPTAYLKDAAEELATWTPSVTGVVNELKVLKLPGSRGYVRTRLSRSPVEDCARDTGLKSLTGRNNAFESATRE